MGRVHIKVVRRPTCGDRVLQELLVLLDLVGRRRRVVALPVFVVRVHESHPARGGLVDEQAEDHSAARLNVAQHLEHCYIIMRSEVGENREQGNEIKTVLIDCEPGVYRQWFPVGVIHFVMGVRSGS